MKSKKQEIVEKASQLFYENGFKGTSLKVLAESVGMEAPSLYNHISNKNELLELLLLPLADEFCKRISVIESSSLSTVQKLEKLVSLHVNLTVEHPYAMGLMLREYIYLPAIPKAQYKELRDKYERVFRHILQSGIEKGELKSLDIDLMLFSLLSTLRSLYAWYLRNKEYNVIELEQQVQVSLLKGVSPERPGP